MEYQKRPVNIEGYEMYQCDTDRIIAFTFVPNPNNLPQIKYADMVELVDTRESR